MKMKLQFIIIMCLFLGLYSIEKKQSSLSDYNISRNTQIKEITIDEAKSVFDDGTGMLILSFPNCEYCQVVLPVIDDLIAGKEIDNIYYLNVKKN